MTDKSKNWELKDDKLICKVTLFPKRNEPNMNGRIYSDKAYDSVVKQMTELIERKQLFVVSGLVNEPWINIGKDVCGVVSLYNPLDNTMVVDYSILYKKMPDILSIIKDDSDFLDVTLMCYGYVDENNVIKPDDIKIIGLSVRPNTYEIKKEGKEI